VAGLAGRATIPKTPKTPKPAAKAGLDDLELSVLEAAQACALPRARI
jgi:hypothetical protein